MPQDSVVLSIPSPCTQAWDGMTSASGGRFCDHCQKTVIDFSGMIDSEVVNYLNKHKGTAICGRMRVNQLYTSLSAARPYRQPFWPKILAGVTLLFSLSKSADAQVRQPGNARPTSDKIVVDSKKQPTAAPAFPEIKASINGTLTSQNGFPVEGAIVQLLIEETNQKLAETSTDAGGHYKFLVPLHFPSGISLTIQFSRGAVIAVVKGVPLQQQKSKVDANITLMYLEDIIVGALSVQTTTTSYSGMDVHGSNDSSHSFLHPIPPNFASQLRTGAWVKRPNLWQRSFNRLRRIFH